MSRPRVVMFGGPVVVISGSFASWLERSAKLRKLAHEVRGLNDEITEGLQEIHFAAVAFDKHVASATGSKQDSGAEVASQSTYVSTTTAADLLDCTDRAVRLACSQGRLSARCVDGRWQVDRQDIERFAEQRNR